MSEVTNSYGPSPVARGRAQVAPWVRGVAAAGCTLVVVGAVCWAVWPSRRHAPAETASSAASWSMGMEPPDRPFRLPPPAPPAAVSAILPPPAAVLATSSAVKPRVQAMALWEDANAAQQASQAAAERTEAARKAAQDRASAAAKDDPDVATPGGQRSEYAQRMQATKFADTAPTPHHFHVQYTIKKGTIFPCTPASPISSGLPGPVQCTTTADVWSMDGTTILLPRGTQVNGSIERGLGTGEERLFLVWTDALTPMPDLLAIPLDAPAADEMGQVGAPGDVNDHLWKKIKTALLLSMVDIGGSAISAAANNGRGNQTFNLGSAGGTASSLGQMAFGHDLNIPSTLYRGPGQPLSVYVNKYIDLYRFYQNRVVN